MLVDGLARLCPNVPLVPVLRKYWNEQVRSLLSSLVWALLELTLPPPRSQQAGKLDLRNLDSQLPPSLSLSDPGAFFLCHRPRLHQGARRPRRRAPVDARRVQVKVVRPERVRRPLQVARRRPGALVPARVAPHQVRGPRGDLPRRQRDGEEPRTRQQRPLPLARFSLGAAEKTGS